MQEALNEGIRVKTALLGPFTLIKLGSPTVPSFDPLILLEGILAVYEQVIRALATQVEWIQLDEPVLVHDLSETESLVFRLVYERLTRAAGEARILLSTYFESLASNATLSCMPAVDAVHIEIEKKQVTLYDTDRSW